MVDVVDKATRSRMMSGIRAKDTRQEVLIRSALHKKGFRFRKNVNSLPGRPDIVLPRYKAVIMVNGCFWHGHDCHLFRWPSTRPDFWRNKISSNRLRDGRNLENLNMAGWRTLVIWECTLRGSSSVGLYQLIEAVARWIQFGVSNAEIPSEIWRSRGL